MALRHHLFFIGIIHKKPLDHHRAMAMMGVLVNYLEVGMGTFTKGPWVVDHKSPFLVRAGDDIDGRHIAHVGPANYTPRFDVDEHNAQLIAAAPDLLEALEAVLNAGRGTSGREKCQA